MEWDRIGLEDIQRMYSIHSIQLLCKEPTFMISNLALKYEGFNPKVGSTYIFYGLNPSIEDSAQQSAMWVFAQQSVM